MKGHKILVFEDDPAIRDVVKTILTEKGFAVVISPDGSDIESILKTQSPDLILADINLSQSSGNDILAVCKKNYPNIPVILVSGRADGKDFADRFGANDFLAKPFNIDELLTLVNKHLGH